MRETYKWTTLGLATLITVAVSLACSYWFFYSLMGSEGYQAVGAGIAGCAIQLFGYGFAATFLPLKLPTRIFLCAVPLALSMLSSYSALYGYLSKEKATENLATIEQKLIVNILEQSAKDKVIASSAAQQGVTEAYRTQAKGFLQFNDVSRDKDEQLLSKLNQHKAENANASPLDGLVKVTGDSEITIIIFCAWLAIMFDILPVIAISVISHRREDSFTQKTLAVNYQEEILQVPAAEANTNHKSGISAEPGAEDELEEIQETIQQNNTDMVEASTNNTEKPNKEVTFSDVIAELIKGELEPKYKAIREYTGWKQWRAQEFFKHCQENNILEKDGRTFKIITNVMAIESVRKVANA